MNQIVRFKFLQFFLSISLIIVGLSACQEGHGYIASRENLTVFYDRKEDLSLADSIANFWVENQLTDSSIQQSIKLQYSKKGFYKILLIANDSIDKQDFPFTEVLAFSNLQSDLRKYTQHFFTVVLCDGHFQPIYQPVP